MKSAYSAVPTYDYSPEKAGGRYNDIMPPKYIESLGGDDDDADGPADTVSTALRPCWHGRVERCFAFAGGILQALGC